MLTENDCAQLQRREHNAKCRPKGLKWFDGTGKPTASALSVLHHVDQLGYRQQQMAQKYGVSPQWISMVLIRTRKWVEKRNDDARSPTE